MKPIELDNLAAMFRRNDPNLFHVSTLNAMHDAGMAYIYGYLRGIPAHHKRKRAQVREEIAILLTIKAEGAEHALRSRN